MSASPKVLGGHHEDGHFHVRLQNIDGVKVALQLRFPESPAEIRLLTSDLIVPPENHGYGGEADSDITSFKVMYELGAEPLLGVDVVDVTEALVAIPCDGDVYRLTNLYPVSTREFSDRFLRPRNREPHKPTLIFILRQVLEFYYEDPAHRVIAAVIYAYRMLDTGRVASIREALRHLDRVEKLVHAIPRTGGVRTDREQLRYSIAAVKYHLMLFLGKTAELKVYLANIVTGIEEVEDTLPVLALNLCRLFLLLGILELSEGDPEGAERTFIRSLAFYRRSVANVEDGWVHFDELKQAHTAVVEGLRLLAYMRGEEPPLKVSHWGAALLRINEGNASIRITRVMKGILESCKAGVAAAA